MGCPVHDSCSRRWQVTSDARDPERFVISGDLLLADSIDLPHKFYPCDFEHMVILDDPSIIGYLEDMLEDVSPEDAVYEHVHDSCDAE